ncbi:hypothetical protein NDU88_007909, partial [Pleurodeles waltl]
VVFPKMMSSVLSELILRQLSLIQMATASIPEWKFLLAVSRSLVREMMSCVSSAYDTMFIPWLLTMAARGAMYTLNSVGLSEDPWGTLKLTPVGLEV